MRDGEQTGERTTLYYSICGRVKRAHFVEKKDFRRSSNDTVDAVQVLQSASNGIPLETRTDSVAIMKPFQHTQHLRKQ
jgi:hypothetical protein